MVSAFRVFTSSLILKTKGEQKKQIKGRLEDTEKKSISKEYE